MHKGDVAFLHITKLLRAGDVLDENEYKAIFLQYDEKKESIFFLLQSGKLTDLSLDAIYECRIQTEKEALCCTGRIVERYCGIAGKMFRLEIENGFYKINVK